MSIDPKRDRADEARSTESPADPLRDAIARQREAQEAAREAAREVVDEREGDERAAQP